MLHITLNALILYMWWFCNFHLRMFLWFVAVSVVLVLVQLYVACRRVEDGQVANHLRRPAVVTVALLVLLVGYVVGICVVVGLNLSGKTGHTWFLFLGIVYILYYKLVPYMFVIFFGWKMLQDLGRQCCCRRYRRRRGYGQIPGQEERGVLSVQTGVPSTDCSLFLFLFSVFLKHPFVL